MKSISKMPKNKNKKRNRNKGKKNSKPKNQDQLDDLDDILASINDDSQAVVDENIESKVNYEINYDVLKKLTLTKEIWNQFTPEYRGYYYPYLLRDNKNNDNTKWFDVEQKDEVIKLYDVEDKSFPQPTLNELRVAAEVHRRVRGYMMDWIKPGVNLYDLVERLENATRTIIQEDGLKCGIGFPTGCSLDNCAAHFTPNPGQKDFVLKKDSVCKIDYGVHVNGRIIDSAFTVCFDPRFQSLLDASRDGTYTGIQMAGPDALLADIGEVIEETINSYELELDGKIYPIKSVSNLGGHNITPYIIHSGKFVFGVKPPDNDLQKGVRMEAGECYAIETFASSGKGMVVNDYDLGCSHYMMNPNSTRVPFNFKSTRTLYSHLQDVYTTLPFCKRWLDDKKVKGYNMGLKKLVQKGVVNEYPPLSDIPGSYVSQLEHTILVREGCTEILSKGDDY